VSDPIRLVDLHELVGRSEIAKRSGARLQTVDTWRRRYADFPTPVGTISGTPLWLWSDVERWINETPREVGRPSSRRTPATPIAPRVRRPESTGAIVVHRLSPYVAVAYAATGTGR
jgi:hypothetical protein